MHSNMRACRLNSPDKNAPCSPGIGKKMMSIRSFLRIATAGFFMPHRARKTGCGLSRHAGKGTTSGRRPDDLGDSAAGTKGGPAERHGRYYNRLLISAQSIYTLMASSGAGQSVNRIVAEACPGTFAGNACDCSQRVVRSRKTVCRCWPPRRSPGVTPPVCKRRLSGDAWRVSNLGKWPKPCPIIIGLIPSGFSNGVGAAHRPRKRRYAVLQTAVGRF